MASCPACGGLGFYRHPAEPKPIDCQNCDGSGSIPDKPKYNSAPPRYGSVNHKEHTKLGKWLLSAGITLIAIGVLPFFLGFQSPQYEGIALSNISLVVGIGMIAIALLMGYIGMIMGCVSIGLVYVSGLGEQGFALMNVPMKSWIFAALILLGGLLLHKWVGKK